MANNALTLEVTGDRLITMIQRRSGEVEAQLQRSMQIAEAVGSGRSYDHDELKRRLGALAAASSLIEPAKTYQVTLPDLAMLDLIDTVVRC